MGSNPCRIIQLLGIAHPVKGSLFQVQGVFEKTAPIRCKTREIPFFWKNGKIVISVTNPEFIL